MTITHAKVSAVPDGADDTVVRPSDWNAEHVVAIAHDDLSDVTTDQHHAQSHTQSDHTGTGSTSTQAFGDAAAAGIGTKPANIDHKHAMMANPVTAHEAAVDPHPTYLTAAEGGAAYEASGAVATHAAAGDPHTGYRLESADHTHATTGLQGGTVAHSALTGLTAGDPHTQYLLESDANYVDLTDGGATTLHTHAGGSGAPTDVDYLVGTANATLSNEIVVGTSPGGELGGTWASPTVDATHSGSTHTDFIAKAFLDAKGDIITASADNTPAILTVGANDTILMADSAAGGGLKWVASASPSTQAFADAAATGTADTFTRGDHKHAMPTLGYGLSGNSAPAVGLTNASAFASAETTISAATYADIAGCSVSLDAGTWLVFGHVLARAVNAIIQVFVAITHSDNTVISESATSRPASGTANLNSPISASWFGIVSPGSTTTYKLRGARGVTTHTGSWIAMDGNGVNTANHASNNTDKGTGIFAVRIA